MGKGEGWVTKRDRLVALQAVSHLRTADVVQFDRLRHRPDGAEVVHAIGGVEALVAMGVELDPRRQHRPDGRTGGF